MFESEPQFQPEPQSEPKPKEFDAGGALLPEGPQTRLNDLRKALRNRDLTDKEKIELLQLQEDADVALELRRNEPEAR